MLSYTCTLTKQYINRKFYNEFIDTFSDIRIFQQRGNLIVPSEKNTKMCLQRVDIIIVSNELIFNGKNYKTLESSTS